MTTTSKVDPIVPKSAPGLVSKKICHTFSGECFPLNFKHLT